MQQFDVEQALSAQHAFRLQLQEAALLLFEPDQLLLLLLQVGLLKEDLLVELFFCSNSLRRALSRVVKEADFLMR